MSGYSEIDSVTYGDKVPMFVAKQGGWYWASWSTVISFLSTAFTSLSLSSYVKVSAVAVASLPSAATAGAGARATVSDATGTTFNATVTGGGSNTVPVFSDGAAWRVG